MNLYNINNDAKIAASDIIAGKDINVSGRNVEITAKDENKEYEYSKEVKQSGLTVSLGGGTINAINSGVVEPLKRASEASNDKLQALKVIQSGYNALKEGKAANEAITGAVKGKANIGLNIGISSSKSEYDETGVSNYAKGSDITAGENVNIKASEGNIDVHGSAITAKNIGLEAARDISVTAAENTSNVKSESKSRSVGAGFTISYNTGKGAGFGKGGAYLEVSASKGNSERKTTNYTASGIKAEEVLSIWSGKDTNIIGSKVSGNKVVADVGGNLDIESLQEQDSYKSSNKGSGLSITYGGGTVGGSVGAGRSNTKSDYTSVVEQAGIYAGSEGFDINVKGNTDLKGAVIDSMAEADKNSLTTGTLSFQDIENKANYNAGGYGINASGSIGGKNTPDGTVKREGKVSPNLSMPAKEDASSTTRSAVAEGTITITNQKEQKQNIANLNRNTEDALNKLKQIFDVKDVAERQELANTFSELSHTVIGDSTLKLSKEQKASLNIAAGALTSYLASGNYLAGATGAGVAEALQGVLKDVKDPFVKQLIVGTAAAAAGKISGGGVTALATALHTEQFNHLTHAQQERLRDALAKAGTEEEKARILLEYKKLSARNIEEAKANGTYNAETDEVIEPGLMEELNKLTTLFGMSTFKADAEEGLDYNLDKALDFTDGKPANQKIKEQVQGKFVERGKHVLDSNDFYNMYGFSKSITQVDIDQKLQREVGEYAENLPRKINASQIYPNVNFVIKNLSSNTAFALKNVAKLGIVSFADLSYTVYCDYNKYSGDKLTKAVFYDVAAFGVSSAVTLGVGAMGATVGAPTVIVVAGSGTALYFVSSVFDEKKEELIK